MKYTPIIFSTLMVPKVLDGTKTQTRRTKGLELINKSPDTWEYFWNSLCRQHEFYDKYYRDAPPIIVKCPYGQAGDRLWCKETVWESDCGKYLCYLGQVTGDIISETIKYTRDEHSPFQVFGFSVLSHSSPDKKGYAFKRWFGEVDLNKDPWTDMDFALATIEAQFHKKKPARFMPRWASRITLENVIDPYPQRLQEITVDDAKAEGVRDFNLGIDFTYSLEHDLVRNEFKRIWNSLNAKRGYPWGNNNWVWVTSFKVADHERRAMMAELREKIAFEFYKARALSGDMPFSQAVAIRSTMADLAYAKADEVLATVVEWGDSICTTPKHGIPAAWNVITAGKPFAKERRSDA